MGSRRWEQWEGMVIMHFLHTADWQIGMRVNWAGAAANKIREERLDAGRRVVEAACGHGVEFLLVAGDLFEDNGVDRRLVQRVADLLARFPGPVFILPGNHDPLVPGSVWEHPAWRGVDRIHVLVDEQPLPVPGGTLFPCPVREKLSRRDPTAWIAGAPKEGQGIRIGLAHGSIRGMPEMEEDHPIPRDAAMRAGLDYLALGHWHSLAEVGPPGSERRMVYSGTPEPSRFGERDSGCAVMVEIASPGAEPVLTRVETGGLTWRIVAGEIAAAGDLERMCAEVDALPDPGRSLVDVRLAGLLRADERSLLDQLTRLIETRFLAGHLDTTALRASPDDLSWIERMPAGFLREAARQLQEGKVDGPPEIATQALMELYLIAEEVADR